MREELWSWAVAAYGRPGVAEACLALQDDHGQDVPLLLWAAWRGPADAETVEAACDTARSWRDAAIAPLRLVRRTLKKPVPDMEDAARLALREQVKAVELAAERGLLEALEALSGPAQVPAPDPLPALVAAARAWGPVTPRAALATLAARLSA